MTTTTQDLVSRIRDELGLSQIELGRFLGSQASCVSRWESGVTELSEHKLAVFRLIERAIANAGAEKVRMLALVQDTNTPDGIIELVHLGDVRRRRST